MGRIRGVLAVALLATGTSGCWLQAGYGPGKNGFNDLESAVTPANVAGLTEAWSTEVGGVPREPLVTGGSAYVRGLDAVTALDLATGTTRWTATVSGAAMPAIVENALQVPAGGQWCTITSLSLVDGTSLGSRMYGQFAFVPLPAVLDSTCATTDLLGMGSKVVTTTSNFGSIFAPRCGVVAIGGDGIAFVDLSATPQDGSSGTATSGPCGGVLPSPPTAPEMPTAVGDVVVRPEAGSGSLRAYPAGCTGSCSALWSIDTAPTWLGPVVGLVNGDLAVAAGDSTVVVMDTTTHAVSWSGVAGAPLAGPVAADDASIFGATTDGRLVVFPVGGCGAASCSPSWTAALAAPAGARASIGGDVVYVGSTDGTVTAFSADGCGAATCPALWTGSVGAAVSAPPVISDGTLLVAAADGSLTAFTL